MKRNGKKKFIFISILTLLVGLGGIFPNPSVFAADNKEIIEESKNRNQGIDENFDESSASTDTDTNKNENVDATASDTDIDSNVIIGVSKPSDIDSENENKNATESDTIIDENLILNMNNEITLPDEYLNNPVSYHFVASPYNDRILAANGNPIIITEGLKTKQYLVYYDLGTIGELDEADIKIETIDGAFGNSTDGFLFSIVAGGSVNKSHTGDTQVTILNCTGLMTVTGGSYVDRAVKESPNASVTGNTNVIIDLGEGNTLSSIIGGGYVAGQTYGGTADVDGNTTVIVKSGTVTNINGGGFITSSNNTQNANVSNNTNIIIENATITNVYGGGKSMRPAKANELGGTANVGGTAFITINDGIIKTAVYGGGQSYANSATIVSENYTGAVKIEINGGTLKDVIGGGYGYGFAYPSNCFGYANIIGNVDIAISNCTITGHVQGGGALSFSSSKAQADVGGNTNIVVYDSLFTAENIGNFPAVFGGGSSITSSSGYARVMGNTEIEIANTDFETVNSEQPIICGGGAFGTDGNKYGSLEVQGDSSVKIRGGYFNGPVLAGGRYSTTSKDISVKGTALLEISDGTFKSLETGSVASSDNVQVYISGGSVASIPSNIAIYDSKIKQNPVYLTAISLENLKGDGPDTKHIANIGLTDNSYGTADLYTDIDGKLYLYLKEGTVTSKASLDNGNEYSGSVITVSSGAASGKLIYGVYVPVTGITLFNKTMYSWQANTIISEISPADATFNEIIWEITDAGTTSAELIDNKITVKNNGEFILKATIENGTAMNIPYSEVFTVKAVQEENPIINAGISYEASANIDTIYANGNPILINTGSKGLNFYYDYGEIGVLDSNDVWINLNGITGFTQQPSANQNTGFYFSKAPIIYGGALEKVVANTCVTLIDGEIDTIYAGGGRKEQFPAEEKYNVTDTAKINLYGGSVTNVYGGDYTSYKNGYSPTISNVKNSIITLRESNVKTIYAGGNGAASSKITVDNSIINIESGNHQDLKIYVAGKPVSDGSEKGVINSQINISGGCFKGVIERSPTSLNVYPISNITISGGVFSGQITNKMSIKPESMIEILGGVVGGQIQVYAPNKIYISGGSVSAVDNKGNPLTAYLSKKDSTIPVYRVELTINEGQNLSLDELNTTFVNQAYGMNDVKTDSEGKFTVYLPINTQINSAHSGETTYIADPNNIVVAGNHYNYGTISKQEIYLTSIFPPKTIKGYAEGKDIRELGLPNEIEIYTSANEFLKVPVNWDYDYSAYDETSLAYQSFDVQGTIVLPKNILNKDNLPLTTKIKVTLLSQVHDNANGIVISGSMDLTNKKVVIEKMPENKPEYNQLLQSFGEEYIPIGAYEISLVSKASVMSTGYDEYEITFKVDEQYNDKMIMIKQLTQDMIRTVRAKAENGSVKIITSDLSCFMLGVPKRNEYYVNDAAEFKKAINDAGTTPSVIYLKNRFTITSTTDTNDTIVIPNGADIVIIDEYDSSSPNKILTLERPDKGEPTILIETGGKLAFKTAAPKSLTLNFEGDTDINPTYANIKNEGELIFDNVNIQINDKNRNTIQSLGNLTIKGCDVNVVHNTENGWQNLWGAILLEGAESNTYISYSNFAGATYGPMVSAKRIDTLSISTSAFEYNGKKGYKSALNIEGAKQVIVSGTDFSNNEAGFGGALTFDGVEDGRISLCNFKNNQADTKGGSMFFTGGNEHEGNKTGSTNVTLNKVEVSESSVYGKLDWHLGGGGFYVDNNAKVIMTGGSVHDCKASQLAGGGISIEGSGQLEINENAEIYNNSAMAGGGIHSYGSSDNWDNLVLVSAWIHHNEATTSEGGGVFTNNHTPLRIDNVLIRNNEATQDNGGGVWTCNKGYISAYPFEGMAVYDNKAGYNRGADVFVSGPEYDKNIHLSPYMLGGGEVNWMKYSDNWLVQELEPAEESYFQKTLNGYFDSIKLVAQPTQEAKNAAEAVAKVIIEDNKAVKGGGLAINGETISGQYKKTVTVNKVWTGDVNAHQPTQVSVQLYQDDKVYGKPVELNASNSWTYTWQSLEPTSAWTVKEVSSLPNGYIDPTYTGQGSDTVTITNTYIAPTLPSHGNKISKSVIKLWSGDSNSNQPEMILVQLFRNGNAYGDPVPLNKGNNWTYRWDSLNKYDTWTIDEVNISEGYTKSSEIVGDTTIITNHYQATEEIKPLPDKPEDTEMETPIDDNNENPDTSSIGQVLIFYGLSMFISAILLIFCIRKRRN